MSRLVIPDNLGSLITAWGVPFGVLVWLAIGVIKLLTEHGPAILKRYQTRKSDQDEHVQEIERRQLRHEELMELTEAGSRTYTEEQLTHHLSEVYVEFQAVNLFVREIIQARLQEIEKKLDLALLNSGDLAVMKERLAEVRMYTRASYDYLEAADEKIVTKTPLLDEFNNTDVKIGVESSADEVDR